MSFSKTCSPHLNQFIVYYAKTKKCKACERENNFGIRSKSCAKCRCQSLAIETHLTKGAQQTCLGGIFNDKVGTWYTPLASRCPLCNELDGCRDLYLEAYEEMITKHLGECTSPSNETIKNVTEAANTDIFKILLLREQLLSTCNATTRTTTNSFVAMRQEEFFKSIGKFGAYCERSPIVTVSSDGKSATVNSWNEEKDYMISKAECLGKSVCLVEKEEQDSQGNTFKTIVVDVTKLTESSCQKYEGGQSSWYGATWNDHQQNGNLPGRVWRSVSDLTQCEVTIVPCSPGMLCEKNTHPIPCPGGYYCPQFSGDKIICPVNHFCPVGTSIPQKCSALGLCAIGAASQVQPFFLILCALILLILFLLIFLSKKRRSKKTTVVAMNSEHVKASGGKVASIEMVKIRDENKTDEEEAKTMNPVNSMWKNSVENQISINFSDLELVVPGDCTCCKASFCRHCCCCVNGIHSSTRLAGTSGKILPGELTCVMGASGAGKSTFLNIISGKVHHSSGEIFVNGKKGTLTDYKGRIGYVPQNDIMHSDATVKEIVQHSATTRLPPGSNIELQVDTVLALLGLTHVSDVVIGSSSKRGISGGEKKRVNIAMEMVTNPVGLLLDEPTSGLDATTAEDVMSALKRIAETGVTVVAVIHQPRVEIFKMMDTLMLLGRGGKTVYLGKASAVEDYFEQIGYRAENDENFLDFAMDVLSARIVPTGDGSSSSSSSSSRTGEISRRIKGNINVTMEEVQNRATELSEKWEKNKMKWANIIPEGQDTNISPMEPTLGSRAPFCIQFRAFLSRGATIRYCRTYTLIVDLCAFLLDGLVIAVIFGSLPLLIPARGLEYMQNCPTGAEGKCYRPVRNEIGPFGFYMTMALGIVSASVSTKSFCGPEKIIFWREASTGISRFAYFLSNILIEVPVQILGALFFVAPVAAFTDFRGPMEWYFLWSLCLVWCVFGMGHLIGCAFETDLSLSTLLSTILAVLINLFGGYVPKAGTGGYWAFSRWSARALSYIEMGMGYPNDFPTTVDQKCLDNIEAVRLYRQSITNNNNNDGRSNQLKHVALLRERDGCFKNWDKCKNLIDQGDLDPECYLSKYDRYVMDEHTQPDIVADLMILVIFGFVMRIAAFYALTSVRKDKQR
jgi:ABC-type multidrug transport system ATPase subunit